MEELKYFQWIEEFMRPRKSKTNLVVEENEHGKDESSEEEEVAKEKDILSVVDGEESTSYSPNVTTSSEIEPIKPDKLQTKHNKPQTSNPGNPKIRQNNSKGKNGRQMDEDVNPIEKEKISLLRTVADVAKSSEENDEFEIFGNYVAKKMRKLSQRLDEDAMADVEFEITNTLQGARKAFQPQYPIQPQHPIQPQQPYLYLQPKQTQQGSYMNVLMENNYILDFTLVTTLFRSKKIIVQRINNLSFVLSS